MRRAEWERVATQSRRTRDSTTTTNDSFLAEQLIYGVQPRYNALLFCKTLQHIGHFGARSWRCWGCIQRLLSYNSICFIWPSSDLNDDITANIFIFYFSDFILQKMFECSLMKTCRPPATADEIWTLLFLKTHVMNAPIHLTSDLMHQNRFTIRKVIPLNSYLIPL